MLNKEDILVLEELQNKKVDFDCEVKNKKYALAPGTTLNDLNTGERLLISKLASIFIRYADNDSSYYIKVGTACGMDPSTIRKILKGNNAKGKKTINDVILGSICVGLGLDMKTSRELFELYGRPLVYGTNAFTSITFNAIRDHDDIMDYLNDLQRFNVPNVKRFTGLKNEKK